ncbi:hypothetical protein [uncultured Tateyamaria sp.]|uniref:hypothetical protein n=1 Tax=uncultured Tateyamaria sp. TaxID=455651 RepID=UPI002604C095|nr:hypothetical protein [uncultured Tateyamaria sp.]
MAASGIIKGAQGIPSSSIFWVIFAFGVVLTPLWTLRQTRVEGEPPARIQAAISTAAFVVWVIALGEPFSFLHEVYGSLLLIGFTLVVGLIVPHEKQS